MPRPELPLLALLATLCAGAAYAEEPKPDCVSRPDCRFVGAVTIRTDQGVKTPVLNRNMPFLRARDGKQRLWLVIGERVDLKLGGPGEPPIIVVAHGQPDDSNMPNAAPKDTIEIDFAQMKDSTFTWLTVRNGYDRELTYHAFQLSQSGEEHPTSICPVLPHIASYESWPGPMVEIELADFRLSNVKGQSQDGTVTIACK